MNITLTDIGSLSLDIQEISDDAPGSGGDFAGLLQQQLPEKLEFNGQVVEFREVFTDIVVPGSKPQSSRIATPDSAWVDYLAQTDLSITSDTDVAEIAPSSVENLRVDSVRTPPTAWIDPAMIKGEILPEGGNPLPQTGGLKSRLSGLAESAAAINLNTAAVNLRGETTVVATPVDRLQSMPINTAAAPPVESVSARAETGQLETRITRNESLAVGEAASKPAAEVQLTKSGQAVLPDVENNVLTQALRALETKLVPAKTPNTVVMAETELATPVANTPTSVSRQAPIAAIDAAAKFEQDPVHYRIAAPTNGAEQDVDLNRPIPPAPISRQSMDSNAAVVVNRALPVDSAPVKAQINPVADKQPVTAQANTPGDTARIQIGGDVKPMQSAQAAVSAESVPIETFATRGGDAPVLNQNTSQPMQTGPSVAAPVPVVSSAPTPQSSVLPAALESMSLARGADAAEWGNGLGERVSWMINQKQDVAMIRLDPPTLGKLDIQVKITDDSATITIQTQHTQTRDLIESASARLRDFLQESGYQNVNVDVSQRQDQQQARAQTTDQLDAEPGDDTQAEHAAEQDQRQQTGILQGDGLLDTFA